MSLKNKTYNFMHDKYGFDMSWWMGEFDKIDKMIGFYWWCTGDEDNRTGHIAYHNSGIEINGIETVYKLK